MKVRVMDGGGIAHGEGRVSADGTGGGMVGSREDVVEGREGFGRGAGVCGGRDASKGRRNVVGG